MGASPSIEVTGRDSSFYGIELGARVLIRGRIVLLNVGEVPMCRSRAEAEHLGRLLIGKTVAECANVPRFEWARDRDMNEGYVVTSFSVYLYEMNDGTLDQWDYDENGRLVP
jgi:hypothetical protein